MDLTREPEPLADAADPDDEEEYDWADYDTGELEIIDDDEQVDDPECRPPDY